MSAEEQEKIREEYYVEALRYMDNAKSYLQTAGKEGEIIERVKPKTA